MKARIWKAITTDGTQYLVSGPSRTLAMLNLRSVVRDELISFQSVGSCIRRSRFRSPIRLGASSKEG